MYKVSILGASGYTGMELIKLLLRHPKVNIETITSNSHVGKPYTSIYPNFYGIFDKEFEKEDIDTIAKNSDFIFCALPHGICATKLSKDILNQSRVIDLSADFRIKNLENYTRWYGEHPNPSLLEKSVYGLSEINRELIKNASLIANPGCYTTCSILSLYPLVSSRVIDTTQIVIDAKSGISGAGRKADLGVIFCESDSSVKAYKIASHRHTPEIEQELSIANGSDIKLLFTPHLIPMQRGILTTSYAKVIKGFSIDDIKKIYRKFYQKEKFIRLCFDSSTDYLPETRFVAGTNYVDINFRIDNRTNNIILVASIDNLLKGASSQAIQNMNIALGIDESTGINL